MSRVLMIPTLVSCVLSVSCSSHVHNLTEIRRSYYRGDVEKTQATIDKALKKSKREADVLQLDRATALLSQGRAAEAEQLLRRVRDNFDYHEQKALGEKALSMLTDDQRLAYPGEDTEKVLVRAFLAISNLMLGGDDAGAYALQVADKQRQIIDGFKGEDGKNPKASYKQVAVGAYLHAALREETHVDYDDAARSLQLVCNWEPAFAAGKNDLERVKTGHHSAPGNGVLYVITLVGRGPYKVEKAHLPSTLSLLVADRILSATGRHTLPATIAPIKVPQVVVPRNRIASVGVAVDGTPKGETETITDVGRMASEQSEAILPYVIGRAVARRVVKKAIIYGAKEVLKPEKASLGSLALNVAGVAWEATESADTRCWGLLPEKIQVRRVELPAGDHQLSLQPLAGAGQALGATQTANVRVENGRNTYVLAVFPDANLVGNIVTSQR